MASSDTEIANLALGHLGSSKEVGLLTTERSAEAAAIRRFYNESRRRVLRDFPWPFAGKIADLGLEETNPNTEWEYAYRYPSDCLRIRRILSGIRTDTPDSRIPHKEGHDATGLLVFTDESNAQLDYTADVTNVSIYPSDFVMAFSYLLAHYAAPKITGGDPFSLGQKALQLYLAEISRAQANSLNEQQDDVEPESIFIRTRT